jgi:hypothetical protein
MQMQLPRLLGDADGTMAALVKTAKGMGFDKLNDNMTTDHLAQDMSGTTEDVCMQDVGMQDMLTTLEGGKDTNTRLKDLWQRRAKELMPVEIARHSDTRTCNRFRLKKCWNSQFKNIVVSIIDAMLLHGFA